MSMTPEEKRARWAERTRQYREANKEKVVESERRYREANKEKVVERQRQYREANKEKVVERTRQYREANKEKLLERTRQKNRKIQFAKEDGSSFQAWLASLTQSYKVFPAIANLTPDPGQTLAELIHELSGYAMDVCEQIANPPVAEEAPPAQPTPQPDLF
jgi:hypothetical protein